MTSTEKFIGFMIIVAALLLIIFCGEKNRERKLQSGITEKENAEQLQRYLANSNTVRIIKELVLEDNREIVVIQTPVMIPGTKFGFGKVKITFGEFVTFDTVLMGNEMAVGDTVRLVYHQTTRSDGWSREIMFAEKLPIK